jgi:hypothetical protein
MVSALGKVAIVGGTTAVLITVAAVALSLGKSPPGLALFVNGEPGTADVTSGQTATVGVTGGTPGGQGLLYVNLTPSTGGVGSSTTFTFDSDGNYSGQTEAITIPVFYGVEDVSSGKLSNWITVIPIVTPPPGDGQLPPPSGALNLSVTGTGLSTTVWLTGGTPSGPFTLSDGYTTVDATFDATGSASIGFPLAQGISYTLQAQDLSTGDYSNSVAVSG